MKSRQGYKGYVIVARSYEQPDGGFSAEVSIQEHDAEGIMETEFYLPDTLPTQESAIEAGIQAGRQKIDMGFERGSAVVNGRAGSMPRRSSSVSASVSTRTSTR